MEHAGTGGALFRNFYRDFLQEACELTGLNDLRHAAEQFASIAELWTEISAAFDSAGSSGDSKQIENARCLLQTVADLEKRSMEQLHAATE